KSAILCIVVSAGVAALLPFLTISGSVMLIINIINSTLTLFFSPSGIEQQTRIPTKFFPLLKILSVLIVMSNFIFQSHLLAVTWAIQAVTLIRKPKFLKGGESQ